VSNQETGVPKHGFTVSIIQNPLHEIIVVGEINLLGSSISIGKSAVADKR
jgi:hypothetical protein